MTHVDALREPPAEGSSSAGPTPALGASRLAASAEGGGALVCRACGPFVAERRDRIDVDGAHAHSFINPAGAIYRVGCFAAAPGARPWGEPSPHWTWFAGFEWRVATCRGCGDLLGWAFSSEASSFVALILDRLAEGPAAAGGQDAS